MSLSPKQVTVYSLGYTTQQPQPPYYEKGLLPEPPVLVSGLDLQSKVICYVPNEKFMAKCLCIPNLFLGHQKISEIE